MEPRIQYAKTTDGVNIAYAVFGQGPTIVWAPGAWGGVHLYNTPTLATGNAGYRLTTEGLVSRGWRVVRYDGRGTGSSDRAASAASLEERLLDLESVVDRISGGVFALGGNSGGCQTAIAYAVRNPGRVSRLVLQGAYAAGAEFYKQVPFMRRVSASWTLVQEDWDYVTHVMAGAMTEFGDRELVEQIATALRSGISADAFMAYTRAGIEIDVTELLSQVSVPTLVIHMKGTVISGADLARSVASGIPNAQYVESDDLAATIDAFLREGVDKPTVVPPTAPTGLVTILFTDVEGSTALTDRLGDAGAREVMREHERITREALNAHGGSEVKTMGDGFMASFGSATKALECAAAIQKAFAEPETAVGARHDAPLRPKDGIRVRIGLNAGEPIAEDDDLFGTSVIVAARIASQAQGGEILVSDVVRQLVAGKNFLFNDRGEHALKGFEDPVRLWEVRWSE